MVQFKKGQRLKLRDFVKGDQFSVSISTEVSVGVMDYSCFGVDQNELLSNEDYFIFYNQMNTPNNSITMVLAPGSTEFIIDLKKLPKSIKKMVFVVTGDDDITMKNITNGKMKLLESSQPMGEFFFTGDTFNHEKAIILMEVYEKDSIWKLSIVASGYNGGLNTLLTRYGGVEAEEEIVEEPKPEKPIPKQNLISLRKAGDSQIIDLTKNDSLILAKLSWKTITDNAALATKNNIELACMFKLKNGFKSVIQSLGNQFGSQDKEPYIYLEKEKYTIGGQIEKNIRFLKPNLIDYLVIFAFIYEGTPDWSERMASITLSQNGSPDIKIGIDNQNSRDQFYVVASMKNKNNQLLVLCEDKYFSGHRKVDNYYGFGFNWKPASK